MGKEELRKLMKDIPDSYDDFVNCTVRWMVKDGRIQNAILAQLKDKPESDTSDVLEVLCGCLGLGEPLEIVEDDESEEMLVGASLRAGGISRVAY